MTKAFPLHWAKFLTLILCLIFSAGCTDASKARRRLAVADQAFQAQKYDDAEIEYKSVLPLSPRNPIAIRQLGLIYFEEGRLVDAFGVLQIALKQDTNNTQVQLSLAEIYQERRELSNGLGLVKSVLHADPSNARALMLLAEMCPSNEFSSAAQTLETQLREGGQGAAACHSALGWIDLRMQKLSEADSEFQQASARDPKLSSPYEGKAELCFIRKDTKGFTEAFKTAAELSPIRSTTRLKYAEFKMQVGAEEEAKAIVLDMTKKAPDYIPAWLFLMKVDFAERKYDDCKATIDKILARDKYNFEAMLQLGTLALAQHDGPKALSALQHMNELYSKAPQVKYTLAQAYLMNNEKEKARAILKDALALDRDYSPAVKLLANLDLSSDKYSESETLLKESTEKHPDDLQAQMELAETYLKQNQLESALKEYQKMAQKFPKDAEIPRQMAIIYAKQGDRAETRSALEKSLDLAPGYGPTLKLINNLDIAEKHYAEAHNRLDQIIKDNPKAGEPLIMQGDIYWNEGETNKAESAYAKAIELNPELSEAYLDLARIYRESHHEQQALDRLEALVAKHTNDVQTLRTIGVIQQEAGHYDLARVAYEKVLTVDSNDFFALNNLAYVDSEYLGKLDQALEFAERAKKLHPDNPVAADTLGWILFKKHEYARALSSIQESVDQQPTDPEVQMHLGMTYYMLGQEKSARACLERAVASQVNFPDKDLARRHLEILDIDPATATPEVVRKLQSLVHEDPKDPVPWSRLAAIQEQHGEAQKAADSLKTILSINSQDWSAMIRLSRLDADALKDPLQALELAKSAHNLAPDDGSASALLGELVYRSGDYPWALSLLEDAAHRSSNQPSLSYYLGLAYYATGWTADADEAMQKMVQQGGSSSDVEQAKQFLAMRAAVKDPAQAQASSAQVQQILAKDANYVPALMVSAMLSERKGAVDEAVRTYQKVLSIYPLFIPATRQLAILYSHSQRPGDLDKAYELAGKARAALPDDLELAKTLGVLAYRRDDYQKSMLLLREYTDKTGDDGEAFYDLGMDYYKLKQPNYTNLCKQALNRALDLHVSDALAGQAQSILKQLK